MPDPELPAGRTRGVQGRTRVDFFISYTKTDEARAEWIARVLEDEGRYSTIFQAWDFRPGDDFLYNMDLAVQKAGRVIAVVSRSYLDSSRFGAMEWRSALARRAGSVVPVRIEDVEMPGLLAPIAYIDFVGLDDPAARRALLEGLREPQRSEPPPFADTATSIPPVPFMAPDLPPWSVERPDAFAAIVQGLEEESAREAGGRHAVALVGAGGFGKTTLATLICHDAAIRQRFTDGILWVTLGESPVDVVAALDKIHVALTGKRGDFVDAEDAASRVGKTLADKQLLLVVDDVWSRADLEPLLRGGARSVRLVTTRLVEAVDGCRLVKVDSMLPGESGELLTAGVSVPPSGLATFEPLIARLGGWPLLIDLVGAALRRELARGASIPDALAYLSGALDEEGVEAFDPADPAQRRGAITGTLGVSLRMLHDDERRRYSELAVFPAETVIPLPVVARLWGIGDMAARRLATRLDDISLLHLELPSTGVRLHTAVRSYLARQAGDLVALHGRVIDSWGDLVAVREDYQWRFVGYHLDAAKRHAALRSLIVDARWLRGKLDAIGVAGTIAECARLSGDAVVDAVRGALELSGHILARDTSQLPTHLHGRLVFSENKDVRDFLESVSKAQDAPWLRPVMSNLAAPGGSLLRTVRHDDNVAAIAVTIDGRQVVSASNRDVKIWDVQSGEEVLTLEESGLREKLAAFTRRSLAVTGTKIACVMAEEFLRVWTLPSGKLWARSDGVSAMTDIGGLILAAGSKDNIVTLTDSTRARQELGRHARGVRTLAVSANRQRALSASIDRTIRVYDLESGSCVATLHDHDDFAGAAAITPDGLRVVGASGENLVTVWEVATGRSVATLRGHTSFITAVAIDGTGTRALTASGDRTVRLWDIETGVQVAEFTEHTQPVEAVAFLPDGRRAVSGGNDGTWRLWDLQGARDPRPAGHGRYIAALAVTLDGRLITGSGNGDLKEWDVAGGRELRSLGGHEKPINALTVDETTGIVASASDDGTVWLWDMREGVCQHVLTAGAQGVESVAFTRTGEIAAISGEFIEHRIDIVVWNAATRDPVRRLSRTIEYSPSTTPLLAVAADGSVAVSNDGAGVLNVWNFADGTSRMLLKGHTREVSAMAINADGRRVLSGAQDATVRLWDLDRESPPAVLGGHTGMVRSIAMSADGRLGVSGGQDDTLWVWDLEARRPLAHYVGESPVIACGFSPDGRTIFGGDASGRPFALVLEGA